MIITLASCAKQVQTMVRQLTSLRPVPQVAAWVNCARELEKKGLYWESCLMIDLIAKHYGRDVGRKIWNEFGSIPVSERGRGCASGVNTLKFGAAPVVLMGDVYQIEDSTLTCTNILEGTKRSIDLFSLKKTGLRLGNMRLAASNGELIIALEESLYHLEADHETFTALMKFDAKIVGLMDGPETGELLVMKAAKSPLLAPDCVIVKNVLRQPEVIELPNVEQTLLGDCVGTPEGWVTCAGGMQKNEVRFIHPDGSWETRFVHEHRVVRIARSEVGAVSVDETGQAYLWQNQSVVDDAVFNLAPLPKAILDSMGTLDAGIDWKHKRLYLQGLGDTVALTTAWCVTPESATADAFVRQIFPNACGITLAMLGDGRLHFWDMERAMVLMSWQLPQNCAEQNELVTLLNHPYRLSIEDDPRIREIRL